MKEKILNFVYTIIANSAKRYINKTKPIVVGVTGSVGKTGFRMILNKILSEGLKDKKIYTSPHNFNGELGLPLSIFGIEKYNPGIFSLLKILLKTLYLSFFEKTFYDIIILEYGIDHIGEMDFMLKIVNPDFSVVTNIDKVHCKQLGSPDITAKEKYKLTYNTKDTSFVNIDDSYGASINGVSNDLFFYTTNANDQANITYNNYSFDIQDGNIYSFFTAKIGSKDILVKTNLVGLENAGYTCVSLSILDIISYKEKYINNFENTNSIEFNLDLQNGRFSFLNGKKGCVLIDSTYNASPASMISVINNSYFIYKKNFSNKNFVLVLGDMRELGDFEESEHRKLASKINTIADYIFLLGNVITNYTYDELLKSGFDENKIFLFKDYISLGKALNNFNEENNGDNFFVFKGSQNTIFMEESIKYLLNNENDFSKLARQSENWKKTKAI
ncbi:Mur ligase family protein [Candidatus Vampirococcus lugosii]|uniref:UDP-N-acetylmuramyl pentapeptide synthase (MurF) n=1 Tax=Candidatus Vampirococcus lugosii TaxID=2789015 RepID=A0ABS5QN28_9BACT|nr:Mur ligase family protein [Candidatus Vampirococcus lugosii]MBS8122538.1 UDP-N-acetylmuramyl pentapeptide synthase (MurF) [Candidatus Vampirococcus lugosii]